MPNLIPLGSRHRAAMTRQLKALDADDRCDRFMCHIANDGIKRFVDSIGFVRDILIGAVHEQRLVALTHAGVSVHQGRLVAEWGAVRRSCGPATRPGPTLDARGHVSDVTLRSGPCRGHLALRQSCHGGAHSPSVWAAGAAGDRVECGVRHRRCPRMDAASLHGDSGANDCQRAAHLQERGRALLVHGAGGDSCQWLSDFAPAFWAAGYSLMALTLPGHGRQADPSRAQLPDLRACLSAAVQAFDPTLIVGHSLGGCQVQRHVQARPVHRAVLLGSLPPRLPRDGACQETLARLHGPLARQPRTRRWPMHATLSLGPRPPASRSSAAESFNLRSAGDRLKCGGFRADECRAVP